MKKQGSESARIYGIITEEMVEGAYKPKAGKLAPSP